jgi:hypothetical protein
MPPSSDFNWACFFENLHTAAFPFPRLCRYQRPQARRAPVFVAGKEYDEGAEIGSDGYSYGFFSKISAIFPHSALQDSLFQCLFAGHHKGGSLWRVLSTAKSLIASSPDDKMCTI